MTWKEIHMTPEERRIVIHGTFEELAEDATARATLLQDTIAAYTAPDAGKIDWSHIGSLTASIAKIDEALAHLGNTDAAARVDARVTG